jgi:hypothetical protein
MKIKIDILSYLFIIRDKRKAQQAKRTQAKRTQAKRTQAKRTREEHKQSK